MAYSSGQVAERLGVSENTLRRYIREGFLDEPGWERVGRRKKRSYEEPWVVEAERKLGMSSPEPTQD